jgi:hypothetical protein
MGIFKFAIVRGAVEASTRAASDSVSALLSVGSSSLRPNVERRWRCIEQHAFSWSKEMNDKEKNQQEKQSLVDVVSSLTEEEQQSIAERSLAKQQALGEIVGSLVQKAYRQSADNELVCKSQAKASY